MPVTWGALSSPPRTFAFASSRTTPLWTRYMPHFAAVSSALASFSHWSIDGTCFMVVPS